MKISLKKIVLIFSIIVLTLSMGNVTPVLAINSIQPKYQITDEPGAQADGVLITTNDEVQSQGGVQVNVKTVIGAYKDYPLLTFKNTTSFIGLNFSSFSYKINFSSPTNIQYNATGGTCSLQNTTITCRGAITAFNVSYDYAEISKIVDGYLTVRDGLYASFLFNGKFVTSYQSSLFTYHGATIPVEIISDNAFNWFATNTYSSTNNISFVWKCVVSGRSWVEEFPGSDSLSTLKQPFKLNAKEFVIALQEANAIVDVESTFRPLERAYLMHYSYRILKENLDPRNIPSMDGVNICWAHTNPDGSFNRAASRQAANQMFVGFEIDPKLKVPPALNSNHTRGWAIDMKISWTGVLRIYDGNGKLVVITSTPRDGNNPDLWNVGKTYDVFHYFKPAKDPNHWSITGHYTFFYLEGQDKNSLTAIPYWRGYDFVAYSLSSKRDRIT